jgi:Tol biopolymer transport system component
VIDGLVESAGVGVHQTSRGEIPKRSGVESLEKLLGFAAFYGKEAATRFFAPATTGEGHAETDGGCMGSVKGRVGRLQVGWQQLARILAVWLSLWGTGLPSIAQLAGNAPELVSANRAGRAGNFASRAPGVSADGRYVVFFSDASDLVVGDTNEARDVFVRDRALARTERVSVSETGAQANLGSQQSGDHPAINADGNVVAFDSVATNLVTNDTNGVADVFVRLRAEGRTERASVSTAGLQGNGPSTSPALDASGRFVAFQSSATNLVPDDTNNVADIFVRDRELGTTERPCGAVQPNGPSSQPAISADGRFVAFVSAATNLVPNDTNGALDVFVCDRATGRLELVSRSSSGEIGNADSILPAISADGRIVAFKSLASNLVPDDRNGLVDVFVHDRATGQTQRASVSFLGRDSNGVSYAPALDCSGRFVAFGSEATNLVVEDYNQVPSLFLRDLVSQRTYLIDRNALGEQANAAVLDVAPALSCQPLLAAFSSLATNLTPGDENEHSDVYIQTNLLPSCQTDGDCRDQNLCTEERCGEDGICVFTTKTCAPLDACHEAGICDPATGECSNPVKPDGTDCDDSNLCTENDRCIAGRCTGSAVQCTGTDGCHDAGTCDPATGLCPNPRPDGTTCDDGNLCTENDQCLRGRCRGTQVDCSGADGCHDPGECNPETGLCPNPRPDGTPCDDQNLCTRNDQCVRSRCQGQRVNCTGADGCHDAGECDPQTGLCPNPRPDGTACNDGNACTLDDRCQQSLCIGTPKDCSKTDGCHDVGPCDPATGRCPNERPDGTPCSDGNLCTLGDQCIDGTCIGTPKDCSTTGGGCHDIGNCDPRTGQCPNQRVDGTPCSTGAFCTIDEVCIAGFCTGGQSRNCDNGRFCDGVEICNESQRACVSSGSPCRGGEICVEEQRFCATPTPVTPSVTPATPTTPVPTTPTGATPTPTGTVLGPLDRDACSCDLDPAAPRSRSAAVLWATGLAALWWRKRQRKGSSSPG